MTNSQQPKFAISVRQPWAWAIVHLGKDIENRSWPTRLRGPVLIHASKGMTRGEYDDALETFEFARDHAALLVYPPAAELERGGIVGQAEIVDCVGRHNSRWFFGPFGFVLRNARPLPFRPCKGNLGFFVPEYEEAGQ
jgi:hypothetical protein